MAFQKFPQWQTKTYGHRLARAPCQFPQAWSSGHVGGANVLLLDAALALERANVSLRGA